MNIVHFGSNGWHARFDEALTPQALYSVALTLSRIYEAEKARSTILVGYDTRSKSRMLAYVVAATMADQGYYVRVLNYAVTTPMISFMMSDSSYALGIMLSGADYAGIYGGVVLRARGGGLVAANIWSQLDGLVEQAIPDETQQLIRALTNHEIALEDLDRTLVASRQDARSLYKKEILAFIKNMAPHGLCRPLTVVLDYMHGATSGIAAELFEALGCKVITTRLAARDDFGGVHPCPIKPWTKHSYEVLRSAQADVAVIYDGDGMRFSLIDNEAQQVPLHLIAPCILDFLVRFCGERGRVVTTQASSVRICRLAEQLNCETSIVPVGYARIADELTEGDVLLACDEYAGICVPRFGIWRDSILASLLVIRYLQMRNEPLHTIITKMSSDLGNMDYIRKDLRLDPAKMQTFSTMLPGVNPTSIAQKTPCAVSHADGLRLAFDDGSWIMLRPSRTQPTVRIYAEAPNLAERNELLRAAYALAQSKL